MFLLAKNELKDTMTGLLLALDLTCSRQASDPSLARCSRRRAECDGPGAGATPSNWALGLRTNFCAAGPYLPEASHNPGTTPVRNAASHLLPGSPGRVNVCFGPSSRSF